MDVPIVVDQSIPILADYLPLNISKDAEKPPVAKFSHHVPNGGLPMGFPNSWMVYFMENPKRIAG